jgi:hypothetical protein
VYAHQTALSSVGLEQQPSKLWVASSSLAGQAKLNFDRRI